jgi:hypothetical protein
MCVKVSDLCPPGNENPNSADGEGQVRVALAVEGDTGGRSSLDGP